MSTHRNAKGSMHKGVWYVVRYTYVAGNGRRVERTMRAQYLGRSGDDEVFSLRPLAGTTAVPVADIQGCYASATDEPSLPKKPERPFAEVIA